MPALKWLAQHGWLFLLIACFAALSLFRESIIPRQADELAGRSWLLTGDEPTYLLMASAIAAGEGMNVRPAHDREDYLKFQTRPVLASDQYTWPHYYKSWLTPVNDASLRWGDAQKPPFTALLPTFVAPLVRWTDYPRWWWSVLQGLWLCTLGWLVVSLRPARESPALMPLAGWCLLVTALPIGYYSTQLFPEILAGSLLLLFLMSLERNKGVGLALFAATLSLWATPRTAPAVLIVTLGAFFLSKGPGHWRYPAIAVIGWTAFLAFNLWNWSSWFPPMGSSFLSHFLGPIDTEWFGRLMTGTARVLMGADVGLFILGPVFLVGLVALFHNVAYGRRLVDFLAATMFFSLIGGIAMYADFRAGTCPAGRYQVIPAMILAWAAVRMWFIADVSWRGRWMTAMILTGILSVGVALFVALHPNWWYRAYHPLFGYIPIQKFYGYLPIFTPDAPWLKIFAWSVLLLIPWGVYDASRWLLEKIKSKRVVAC
ncbi:hypothetical protein [Desulfonatronum thiodismutans]|uniref:hypothetical protein n=1 Tax=Desulfonatronum thiodismutans TaxID=159290 RepID=UPI0004ABDFAB|nr:hypothetical protein [Desulfonatronum thiodismutans]